MTSTGNSEPVIVWFRSDLRLSDHRPFVAAAASGRPLIACYVLDEQGPTTQWALGGASRWWLHHSLAALAASLEALGGRLVLRRGPALHALSALITETDACAVHCGASAEPHGMQTEKQISVELASRGGGLISHRGALLFQPEAIRNRKGDPFQVFTPYWKTLLRAPDPGLPLACPRSPVFYPGNVRSEALEALQLIPRAPDWSKGFKGLWMPGEQGARACVEEFLANRLSRYRNARDLPHAEATSGLSAHLRFGEISPREVWHILHNHLLQNPSTSSDAEAFLRQLGWREFSYYLLHYQPELPVTPFRASFAAFPWRRDPAALESWQNGQTGYPIVDAGMRQLWQTGWMHNRVRMVVAPILVKHSLIPWQDGARWFWDTLVDADLANNSAGWQWVAGCGADAAPYFRIFNPILQGKKFDKTGAYVYRWVPELSGLPLKYVHEPWHASSEILDAAGVCLGRDYPLPIVDHADARARALTAYREMGKKIPS